MDWLPADGKHYLFFDGSDIQKMHNVQISLCPAQKHPLNPLLPLGDLNQWDSLQAVPWAGRTVLYDSEEKLFKTWYAGTDADSKRWWKSGYAVSRDGTTWEKPRLGLFEYNGNKRNNICAEYFGPVIKDTAEPDPAKRYKMFVKRPPVGGDNSAIDYSPDGMTWGNFQQLDMTAWEGKKGDSVLLLRDEQDPDPGKRYKTVWQIQVDADKPGPEHVRAKNLAYGPSETEWTASASNPILSPNAGLEQENHFLMYIPYRGRYLLLYEYGWYLPDGYGLIGSYAADVRLAFSDNGEDFVRVRPDQKVIARGHHGEWDDQFLVISDKAIIRDNKVYLYYSGLGEAWSSWPAQNQPEDTICESPGCIRISRMGLATLDVDRFTCLETNDGETPGTAVTGPVDGRSVAGGGLRINVSGTLQRRDWVEVEVLGETGDEPLPGFSREECRKMDRDVLDEPVIWNAAAESLPSRIRLRFRIYGSARLHAFRLV